MKTVFSYWFLRPDDAQKPAFAIDTFLRPTIKHVAIGLLLLLFTHGAFAQRNKLHKTKDTAFYISAGTGKMFFQRMAFDQWSRSNFNIMEPNKFTFFADLGYLYHRFDIGAEGNFGDAFSTGGFYVGGRLTGARSPIGSWLNVEAGTINSAFKNISPPTFNKIPSGQDLELDYSALYISLVSKNYLNFLQYNAKVGHAKIPVNVGVFVSAGWQPGKRDWSYGYYDQDSVYHAQKLKPIPKLGKFQGSAGVFAGF